MIERNRFRDKYIRFFEKIELDGVNNIIMVKLQDKEPHLIGRCWFIIFTLLSLATLYKLYICVISVYQTVKIKKLISNNNNLNDWGFNRYNPRVQFLDKIFTYERNYNIVEENNIAQNDLHVNNNNINENNINNEQLNVNNVNDHFDQNDSLSTERNTNISNDE